MKMLTEIFFSIKEERMNDEWLNEWMNDVFYSTSILIKYINYIHVKTT